MLCPWPSWYARFLERAVLQVVKANSLLSSVSKLQQEHLTYTTFYVLLKAPGVLSKGKGTNSVDDRGHLADHLIQSNHSSTLDAKIAYHQPPIESPQSIAPGGFKSYPSSSITYSARSGTKWVINSSTTQDRTTSSLLEHSPISTGLLLYLRDSSSKNTTIPEAANRHGVRQDPTVASSFSFTGLADHKASPRTGTPFVPEMIPNRST